jgi:hypothetical protein
MAGQLTVDANYVRESSLEPLKHHVMYQTPGSTNKGVVAGGGSLTAPTLESKPATVSDSSFPIYNTPPTILFCDESLAPGETKTCT